MLTDAAEDALIGLLDSQFPNETKDANDNTARREQEAQLTSMRLDKEAAEKIEKENRIFTKPF